MRVDETITAEQVAVLMGYGWRVFWDTQNREDPRMILESPTLKGHQIPPVTIFELERESRVARFPGAVDWVTEFKLR